MRSLLASACAAVLVMAIGCAPAGPSLTGTWESSNIKEMPGATMETTFSGGDKVKMVIKGEQMGAKINATVDGTYKLEAEKLSMTFTSADVKLEGLTPDQEKKLEGQKEALNKQFLDNVNKDANGTIKWVDDNTIDLTSGSSTVQMKRKV